MPADPSDRPRVDVSVLVPVLNEEQHIVATVRAMQAQEFDGELEFLFADGRSEDRTKAILEELSREDPRIRVFDNPERRTPTGLNVCLREARGEYVARMDAHTFYPPRYLAIGVERLGRGDTTWVSGPQVPDPTGPTSRAVAFALGTWLGRGGSRKWRDAGDAVDGAREIELDTGVFTGVWRRDRVLESGGWDEGWPSNQDAEMAARFLAAGERLICREDMGARYIPRDALRKVWRQYWGYGYYRVRTARRHPHSLRRSALLAPAIVANVVLAAIAPRPLRGLARAGVAAYAGVLAFVSAPFARSDPAAALRMPGVFAAMHGGNGVGFWQGFWRFGLPWAALARVLGLGSLAERIGPSEPAEVHAPALHDGS